MMDPGNCILPRDKIANTNLLKSNFGKTEMDELVYFNSGRTL